MEAPALWTVGVCGRVARRLGRAVLLRGHCREEVGHAAELLDDGEELAAGFYVFSAGFVRRGVPGVL